MLQPKLQTSVIVHFTGKNHPALWTQMFLKELEFNASKKVELTILNDGNSKGDSWDVNDKNRLLLAGFMKFDELVSYLSSECRYEFPKAQRSVHDEWAEKNVYMDKLHQTDPYVLPPDIVRELDPNLRNYVDEIKEKVKFHSQYKDELADLQIKMVNIDYLIAFQYHINMDRVDELDRCYVKPNMNEKELIEFCLSTKQGRKLRLDDPVIDGDAAQGSATFAASDDDLRLGKVEFRKVFAHEKEAGEPLTEVKAEALVFLFHLGDPFVIVYKYQRNNIQNNGSQADNNQGPVFILVNGFHRAFALRKAGYTHIPCVFCEMTEARMALHPLSWQNRFNSVTSGYMRPPLLKDFFNPRLTMHVKSAKKRRLFKINWNAEMVTLYD